MSASWRPPAEPPWETIGAVLGNVIDAFFIITGFLLFLPTRAARGLVRQRPRVRHRTRNAPPSRLLGVPGAPDRAGRGRTALAIDGSPSLASVGLHAATLQLPAKLFDPPLAIGFGLDGPVWMISVVAGFYVVLPFVASRYLRRPLVGLAVAALLSVAWKLAVVHFDGLFLALAEGAVPRTSSASWPPTSSRAGRSRSRSG